MAKARHPVWKRILRQIGGWVLILIGVTGCVLPVIPGIPLMFAGLALLSSEYVWARKGTTSLKEVLEKVKQKWAGESAMPHVVPKEPSLRTTLERT